MSHPVPWSPGRTEPRSWNGLHAEALLWLRPGGHLLCEIGETQGDDCRQLFAPFEPEIILDLAGRERFVAGVRIKAVKSALG